jgi:hypothetical protein
VVSSQQKRFLLRALRHALCALLFCVGAGAPLNRSEGQFVQKFKVQKFKVPKK